MAWFLVSFLVLCLLVVCLLVSGFVTVSSFLFHCFLTVFIVAGYLLRFRVARVLL